MQTFFFHNKNCPVKIYDSHTHYAAKRLNIILLYIKIPNFFHVLCVLILRRHSIHTMIPVYWYLKVHIVIVRAADSDNNKTYRRSAWRIKRQMTGTTTGECCEMSLFNRIRKLAHATVFNSRRGKLSRKIRILHTHNYTCIWYRRLAHTFSRPRSFHFWQIPIDRPLLGHHRLGHRYKNLSTVYNQYNIQFRI